MPSTFLRYRPGHQSAGSAVLRWTVAGLCGLLISAWFSAPLFGLAPPIRFGTFKFQTEQEAPPQRSKAGEPSPSADESKQVESARPLSNEVKDAQTADAKEPSAEDADDSESSGSDPLADDDKVTTRKHSYDYKKIPNVTYSKGDGYSLLCDIYQPEGDGPFPALLAVHGGAWTHGSKLNMFRHAWKFARAGYVVIAINYRHAPQYKFPAQVHDCKQAVRWIRSKQEKLKIDPDQVAVFGYSAGGHLGAMLGATDDKDGLEGPMHNEASKISTRVNCVVVGGGPCEFSWLKSRALVHWLGDSPQNDPEVYKQASPLTYVTPDDPPFIFFHGGGDGVVPIESAKKMHQSLEQSGIESKFHTVGMKGHLATFTDTGWLDDAIAFLDEKLKRTHHE